MCKYSDEVTITMVLAQQKNYNKFFDHTELKASYKTINTTKCFSPNKKIKPSLPGYRIVSTDCDV